MATIKPHLKHQINTSLGVQETTNLGRYLGLPLSKNLTYSSTYHFLVEHIYNILNCWENKYLTLAWKSKLIKTTLSSLPIRIMQFIKLPDNIFKKFIKLLGTSYGVHLTLREKSIMFFCFFIREKSIMLIGNKYVNLFQRVA